MHDFHMLIHRALDLLIAVLAWRYYRNRLYYNPYAKYSTFWPRFCAGTIDSLVLWPGSVLTAMLPYCDWPAQMLLPVYVALALSSTIYSIALHTKYGQTVGKMVCKVRVVDWKTEGPIDFSQALLRDAVPLIMLGILLVYQSLRVITGKVTVGRLAQPEELQDIGNISPWLFLGIPMIWFVLEIVTMLTNEQRRALHDFIAGTVVVRTNMRE
jgi:uncharacterized RDD family membrane protein YckC